MMDVGRHPRIQLMAYSQVESISGYVGNFSVQIRKKTRYLDETACTACGDCADVCPVTAPDEFQAGLATRKAVYIPFPQAVPSAYLINVNECLGNNPIACGKCREACDKDCIDWRGRRRRRHRFGYVRPHRLDRIRLHPPRKRHHQP
jgi:heterodisulfide reductase subunit A